MAWPEQGERGGPEKVAGMSTGCPSIAPRLDCEQVGLMPWTLPEVVGADFTKGGILH